MNEKPIRKTVAVALPIDLHTRLKTCAETDCRTLSGEIRQILRGYVEYLDRGGVSWCDMRHHPGLEQNES